MNSFDYIILQKNEFDTKEILFDRIQRTMFDVDDGLIRLLDGSSSSLSSSTECIRFGC